MKITEFEIFRYDLPLIASIKIGNVQVKNRSGLIIRIRDEESFSGIGEIAPLPGLHGENLEEALTNLNENAACLLHSEVPSQLEELGAGFEKWIGRKTILPSVQFGLEMAILNLLADRTSRSLGRLLSKDCQETIAINGLVFGGQDEIIDQTKRLIRDGYQTLKMKVGRKSLDEEIRILEDLRDIINGKAHLRLDANRRWSYADAVSFAKSIDPDRIEYIEEPFPDVNRLSDFFDHAGMPFALDESLQEHPLDQLQNMRGLKAFVIKPSVIGGFGRSMKLVRYAKARRIYPVISSAFESGVGLSALANFAASMNPGNVAMGLDTSRWFAGDLPKMGLKTSNGKMDVESAYRNGKEINYELLRKIN